MDRKRRQIQGVKNIKLTIIGDNMTTKKEVTEHRKRMQSFYKTKSSMVDFIVKFFQVKEGLRCRVRLDPFLTKDGKPRYIKYDPSNISGYGGKYKYPLQTITHDNIEDELIRGKTLFFFEYIFDEDVTKCNSTAEVKDHIIGITPVMDVDSPHVIPEQRHPDGRKKRIDILSKYGIPVMDNFERIRIFIKPILEDSNIWKDMRMMCSGNGMYFIFPDLYGTQYELLQYYDSVSALIDDTNTELGREYIDAGSISWYKFFKVPYTFHNDYNRLSIPIDRDIPVSYVVSTKDW